MNHIGSVICIVGFILIFFGAYKKRLNPAVILALSFATLILATYPRVTKIANRWLNIDVAKEEINEFAQEQMRTIKSTVEENEESIKLLTSSMNRASDKIESQTVEMVNLIETAKKLQDKTEYQEVSLKNIEEAVNGARENIEQMRQEVRNMKEDVEKAKNDIEKVKKEVFTSALSTIKTTYLLIQTGNEFGTERKIKAVKEIESDINEVLPIIIPDDQKRREWIRELNTILPQKQ